MAKLTDALRASIGAEVEVVFVQGGPFQNDQGMTYMRDEETIKGVLNDVFDDGWVLIDGVYVNLEHVRFFYA